MSGSVPLKKEVIMAKEVNEQEMTLVVKLTKEGANPIQVAVRADYKVTSEDLEVTRSLDEVALTSGEEDAIKLFGINVLQQIKDAEGIS